MPKSSRSTNPKRKTNKSIKGQSSLAAFMKPKPAPKAVPKTISKNRRKPAEQPPRPRVRAAKELKSEAKPTFTPPKRIPIKIMEGRISPDLPESSEVDDIVYFKDDPEYTKCDKCGKWKYIGEPVEKFILFGDRRICSCKEIQVFSREERLAQLNDQRTNVQFCRICKKFIVGEPIKVNFDPMRDPKWNIFFCPICRTTKIHSVWRDTYETASVDDIITPEDWGGKTRAKIRSEIYQRDNDRIAKNMQEKRKRNKKVK